MSAATVLLDAAARAESQPTLARAISAGWGALHADTTETMGRCFDAWARAEDFGAHPSGSGAVLRRRYTTPAEIAASLRRAAAEETE